MASRISTRRPFVRSSKRAFAWTGSADQGFVAIGAGASVIVSFAPGLGDDTIVRVRGEIAVNPSPSSADNNIVGAWGMGIVSDEAFAAGAASIPGPWTNKNWGGWFAWQAVVGTFEVTTDISRLLMSLRYPIDSKAMRKVKTNETVVEMYESQATAQTVASAWRMGLKIG